MEELLDDLDLSEDGKADKDAASAPYKDPQDEAALQQLKAASTRSSATSNSAESEAASKALEVVAFDTGPASAIPEADDEDASDDED